MDLKDSVVRLYVKRFIIPKALIFDKPGFVDFRISGKTNVFARQVLVPESFFADFEKRIVDQFGDKGEQMLYSAGKKFGYRFAMLGRFENIKDHPGDKVKDWIIVASKFVEGTYASEISATSDIKTLTVDYVLKGFVICRKIGYDHFLARGGAAGMICWMLQNPRIEAYLYDSSSPGENHACKVKCALPEALSKEFGKICAETDLSGLEPDFLSYAKLNSETELQYKKSLQNFLDSKLFSYVNGAIQYKDERFFLMEVSALYLLDKSIVDKNMKKILFDSAFSAGKKMFSEFNKNSLQTILEILCALGWGEPIMLPDSGKIRVAFNHFPWTEWAKESDYSLLKGLLSGIFSRLYDREIIFKKPVIDLSKGYLALLLEENT